MFLGLFPELTAVGGVQQVSRHAGAALEELAGRQGCGCRLIGLNDPAGDGMFTVGGQEYHFSGFARNKGLFLSHLSRLAPQTTLVFASHVNLGPPALWMRGLKRRLQYWVMAHGMEVWQPLSLARRVALRKAHGVVAVSHHTAQSVERVQGIDPRKINVLHPALDPDYLLTESEPPQLPVPSGSCFLLTVARLLVNEPGKGVDTVIRALPRLLQKFPKLYYLVVGDGDARPSLELLAKECGVAEHVVFTGRQATGSLRGYYEAADVFVMPSRQEGFGIAFLEAMSACKPSVAARCGGAPEVVSDGETGFLVDYGDVSALEARLTDLLADEGLRHRMGAVGYRQAIRQYGFHQFRERLQAILANNRH